MVELIITEKPKASQRVAMALADGKPIKESVRGVPYYKVTRGNTDIIVGCAVGHLFTLAPSTKSGFTFPVFEVEWKPTFEVDKSSKYAKKYFDVLKKLSKQADKVTVATDYDIEGEVIGLNVVKYICKREDAARMKFSTLTKPDLERAYETKQKTLDWGQAIAGTTRHELDWYWGINLSRALTSSVKAAGRFKILSTGRVQGPALKIVVEREREIKAFVPKPFWQILLKARIQGQEIEAWHERDKFWEKGEAESALERARQGPASVASVTKSSSTQSPPHPFDLTSLQIEAYRVFRISPKETLSIAQELYTSGLISYPRTSSQKLPKEIGYEKIVSALGSQEPYSELARTLLQKSPLRPNEGKKQDEAHPAIYPTGLPPKNLGERTQKIYDLVVRRFLATFGEPAKRETITLKIDSNNETFVAKGTRTVEKGWHVYYEPYLRLEEQTLPDVREGDKVEVSSIEMLEKETQPPKRYTPASLIRELEKRGLGTKATRAAIIETLYQRHYIEGASIEATELGIKTVEMLEKFVPEIVDEALTRHFEEMLEEIRKDINKREKVLEEAKSFLVKTLQSFKDNEKEIGSSLNDAHEETRAKAETIGQCPECKTGTLQVKRGKFGRFIACTSYPECKVTFKLPATGMVKPSQEVCEHCSHPVILVIRRGKRPQELCINPECPSKSAGDSSNEGEPCPKCKEGKLVLRKSIYGQFYGCSNYPKCRFIKKN